MSCVDKMLLIFSICSCSYCCVKDNKDVIKVQTFGFQRCVKLQRFRLSNYYFLDITRWKV